MHNQAAATTAHHGHTLDPDFLTAAFDPAKWDPYFDPSAQLPVSLLGDLLHAGIHPADRHRRGLYSAAVADGPVLRDDRIWTSVTAAGSLFAGWDQCPQAVLHHLRHGGVQGVQRHLQLVDAGQDSLPLDYVMVGIDKSKPFPTSSRRTARLPSPPPSPAPSHGPRGRCWCRPWSSPGPSPQRPLPTAPTSVPRFWRWPSAW